MFDRLGAGLSAVLDNIRRKGALTEADVDAAMRQIRVALLEADVALPVAKKFIEDIKGNIVGAELLKSVSPAQMVAKKVNDALVETLGGGTAELELKNSPSVILMAGIQGSGKTTSSGKLARLLMKEKKKVLLASLDVYRPAAQRQLAILAERTGAGSLPIIEGEQPEAIAKRALKTARDEGYDVLIADTAGRLHVDETLLGELKRVKTLLSPDETLLTVDSMTGQDAVNIAKRFSSEDIGVTGVILTRLDGDAQGGAALSMRYVTGCAIKFAGTGEKIDEFERFHPDRVAGNILGMGDIVSFVERAAEQIDENDMKGMEKRMRSGRFTFDDMLKQFGMMKKMGGVGSMMKFLPGMGELKEKLKEAQGKEKDIARMEGIILSMTKAERRNPDLLNGSRKRRIAAGAGVQVVEVNRLIKSHKQMSTMMRKFSKTPPEKLMRQAKGAEGMLRRFGKSKRK